MLLSIFQYRSQTFLLSIWPEKSISHYFKTLRYEVSLHCFLQVHTNFHSHKQFPRVPYSPKPCQHLSLDFGIMSAITGINWYITMVSSCNSIIISDYVYTVFQPPFGYLYISYQKMFILGLHKKIIILLYYFLVTDCIAEYFEN